jgi:hypothetical protein
MNKTEELKQKLEQAKKDKESIQENIDWLEKKLAEAEKPKLRHGDWWMKGDSLHIYMKEHHGRDFVAIGDCILTKIGSSYGGEPILGNIIDDLKRNAEDLEKFDVYGGGTRLFIRLQDNDIVFDIGGFTSTMHKINKATEIHQKLGQLIATAKRKQHETSEVGE